MKHGGATSRLALVAISVALLVIGNLAVIPAKAVNTGSSPCVADLQTTSTVVTATYGTYCYLAFLSGTNTWTPPSNITTASVLIIAGGGAGGAGAWAGGGGAGGIVYIAAKSLTPSTTYSTSVGAGGTSGIASITDAVANRSTNGSDSWFESSSTFVAKGGGAGASYSYGQGSVPYSICDGSAGGSGGGAPECNNAGYSNDGGASTQTLPAGANLYFGTAGGGTATAAYASGGGGGGAGLPGTAVTTTQTAGAGGAGTTSFSIWLTALSSAMSGVSGWSTATSGGYIAGGGGGSANTPGSGGSGGGGAGGNNVSATKNGVAGVTNTGSGGGGSGYASGSGLGGAGGSGIIMIRYAIPSTFNLSLAGNPTSVEYNRSITITASITGQDGKVSFYANGKVIPGCKSKQSVSLVATCSWKPAVHKSVTISASLVNSSTVSATPIKTFVVKRTNTR
jgi:hypothetical protein